MEQIASIPFVFMAGFVVGAFFYFYLESRPRKKHSSGALDEDETKVDYHDLMNQKHAALKFIVSQVLATMKEGGQTIITEDKCDLRLSLRRHAEHARRHHRDKVSALSTTEVYLLGKAPWVVFRNAYARGLFVQVFDEFSKFLYNKFTAL